MTTMYNPAFSIIIPHYNIPDLLMRCLKSIPVREDIQVIVVDDCSPGANKYLEEYPALSRPYLELYHTPVGGSAGRARNIGLDHAKGKRLIFIDADDFFVDDMVSILEELKGKTEDIIFYNYIVVKNDDLTTPGVRNWYSKFFEQYAIDKNEEPFRYRYESLVGKLFKRQFVEDNHIRFDETSHSNDVGFSFKCGTFAKSIAIIDKTFFIVTEREGSLASSQFTKKKPSIQEYTARMSVALNITDFKDQHHINIEYTPYKGFSYPFFKFYPLSFSRYFFGFILPNYPQYAYHVVLSIIRAYMQRIRRWF